MVILKKDIQFYMGVILYSIISILIIYNTESVIYDLLCIGILVVIAVFKSKFDFSHPYFWFSSFFFLYNCAYLIITIIAPNDSIVKGYDKNCSALIIISLVIILLSISLKSNSYNFEINATEQYKEDSIILKYLLIFFTIIMLLCIILLKIKGITSKQEQWIAHNMYWVLATYCSRFNTFIIALLIFLKRNNKVMLVLNILIILYFSLITGERDAILRILLLLLLVYAMLGKIKFKQIIAIVPAGIGLMILLNYFKYFFRTGIINRGTFVIKNTLYEFLYSDFVDCGSNLQMLVSHSNSVKGSQGVGIIIKDILSAILPTGVMNSIFGQVTNWNTSVWYNDYFFRGSSWNRAFSLVGEGYVIGGVFGIILLFLILGMLIRYIYVKSNKSPYFAAIYTYTAVTIISSFRGEFGTIISSVLRIPLFVICFIFIFKSINNNKIKKRELI